MANGRAHRLDAISRFGKWAVDLHRQVSLQLINPFRHPMASARQLRYATAIRQLGPMYQVSQKLTREYTEPGAVQPYVLNTDDGGAGGDGAPTGFDDSDYEEEFTRTHSQAG